MSYAKCYTQQTVMGITPLQGVYIAAHLHKGNSGQHTIDKIVNKKQKPKESQ